ncbi:MAG: hypothetical protein HeimC3_31880 [Candidatus Heimdallarchaeota archaeon LC_3]|nr:MAG: hypothetical protein HeimC3_31880 [Candidatus Heimdallarchaeota archaeon LC_3]
MTILFLIYFFTIYPLALSLTWLVFQILFFPLSFLVALYFHKFGYKAFEEDEGFFIDERSNPFLFELHGFVKRSKSFLIVILLAFIFSFFGIMFIFGFIALILILFPSFYKRLSFLPKWGLVLANPIFGFLSYNHK